LLRVQDEERRRLARDLHDSTGQELAVAILTLEHAAKDVPPSAAKARSAVLECTDRLRKVENDVRTLSYVLHPPLLEEMGLVSALQWYLDGFSKRTGIKVSVEVPPQMPRLHTDRETALFRVIQESLTNVFRHSGSRKAWVNLSTDQSFLRATVIDEGKGFDSAARSSGTKSGVGIQSMKGRLELLGGSLEIESKPKGRCVTATVPIYSEEETRSALPLASGESATNQSADLHGQHNRKRILIADDHEVARRGIKTLLNDQPDLEICGEAEDGVAAVAKVKQLQPDLVILDLSMPNLGGLSAAHQIRSAGMQTKILIYTTHSYAELEKTARAAGCDGFVTKSKASHDLIRAARMVLRGEKFYSESPDVSRAQSA
jgi:CheY-like chemotaxis protein